jgi:outer membrane putative beta-barrel porin/alpha-amylase
MRFSRAITALLLAGWVGGAALSAAAQELEPRAYSPSPVGTTFLVVSATRSAGGVLTDPTLPVADVDAEVGVLVLAVGHTFSLAGRQALVLGAVPVTWAEASGQVGEDRRSVSRRGLADSRVKLSVILAGSRAMTAAEFVRAPRRAVLGASVTVVPPLGQYDPARLINLGSNRWSFKPEIGVSLPSGRWNFDGYAGVWLFTDNATFYPGTVHRHQNPIVALQGHVSYTLARRAWLALDGTWYSGGRSIVNGVEKLDLQRSTRLGATLSLPIGSRQSIKIAYSDGATTRFGGDFQTIGVAWQLVRF